MNTRIVRNIIVGLAAVIPMLLTPATGAQAEDSAWSTWYSGVQGGYAFYEGDEPIEGGTLWNLMTGYQLTSRFGIEGSVGIMPSLDSNDESSHGAISDGDDVLGVRLGVDGLYHFFDSTSQMLNP